MLQLTYELRPKWQNNNKNKTQNAVSRSDPLQGSDNQEAVCPSLVSFFVECRNFDLTTVRLEEWSIIVRLVQRPDMVVTMRKYFESKFFHVYNKNMFIIKAK